MAQAARLSLRLQKELKLLLADPPPSTTFPLLSAAADSSSLTTIEAHMEGPEGTVYAEGTFVIKIQVPEVLEISRYPFQPPIATFATPIYHPNIDTGGRICLDILNLPPKGAWQPSLNISTVITSIMLLLSEPNPDDGLMCEASREYKYNRQAFNQKARAMTEKHAKSGVSSQHSGDQSVRVSTKMVVVEEGLKIESKVEAADAVHYDNNPSGTSEKLSLEPSTSTSHARDGDGGGTTNEVLKHPSLMQKPSKANYEAGVEGTSDLNSAGRYNKLTMNKSRLSLGTKDENAGTGSKHLQQAQNPQSPSMPSSWPHSNFSPAAPPMPLHGANVDMKENALSTQVCKKASYVGKKLSLGLEGSPSLFSRQSGEKENLKPQTETSLSSGQISPTTKSTSISRKLSLGPLTQLKQGSNVTTGNLGLPSRNHSNRVSSETYLSGSDQGEKAACDIGHCGQESLPAATDSIIVLDSEDSEEEMGLIRPKLRLRMVKRRKSQA